jgi:radical SAM superfamily enzyme YgiQ (UPF0313 family)
MLEKYSHNDFEQFVKERQPDVVGIKTYSCDVESVGKMLLRVKNVSPETVTVIGGPHPSCEPPEHIFEEFPGLDYAFAGEAELGFVPFLEKLASNGVDMSNVAGLIWKDDDDVVRANPRGWVDDLEALEPPAWDLINPRRYKWAHSFMTSKFPAVPMAMTRGCPYSCTFCGSHLISGRKVRKRSVDNIIEEIGFLKREYGVRSIDITDENFAFDRRLVVEFCERLLSEDLRIAWNCPYGVRIDSLDEELVRLMARSGCFGLSLGIESGSQRILDLVKKRIKVEDIVEKVRMIKRVSKIKLSGYFMLGFPEETREEIEETVHLACSLPFDFVLFSPLRVVPGTEIYSDLQSAGIVTRDADYRSYGHRHNLAPSYCCVPDAEMQRIYRRAYARFYFRLPVVLNLLRQVRSATQLKIILNAFLRAAFPVRQS